MTLQRLTLSQWPAALATPAWQLSGTSTYNIVFDRRARPPDCPLDRYWSGQLVVTANIMRDNQCPTLIGALRKGEVNDYYPEDVEPNWVNGRERIGHAVRGIRCRCTNDAFASIARAYRRRDRSIVSRYSR